MWWFYVVTMWCCGDVMMWWCGVSRWFSQISSTDSRWYSWRMVIDDGWRIMDIKFWLKPHSITIKNGLTSTKLSIKSPFLLIKLEILNLNSRLLTLESFYLILGSWFLALDFWFFPQTTFNKNWQITTIA